MPAIVISPIKSHIFFCARNFPLASYFPRTEISSSHCLCCRHCLLRHQSVGLRQHRHSHLSTPCPLPPLAWALLTPHLGKERLLSSTHSRPPGPSPQYTSVQSQKTGSGVSVPAGPRGDCLLILCAVVLTTTHSIEMTSLPTQNPPHAHFRLSDKSPPSFKSSWMSTILHAFQPNSGPPTGPGLCISTAGLNCRSPSQSPD